MPRQFEAHYRLTFDDYLTLARTYLRLTRARRIGFAVHAAIDALLFVAGIVAVIQREWFWAAYFFALGLILLALRVVVLPWQRRRQFDHQRMGDFDVSFAADQEGISVNTELASGAHKWAAIRRVDDLPHHVLLWPNNRFGWIVPKRAFATHEEAAAFAGLAKEKTIGQKL